MAEPPKLDPPQWDKLPVGDTRPAMKAGVPFLAIFPIFFGPAFLMCVLFIITRQMVWWLLILTPISWFAVGLMFAGNFNRPSEWMMSFMSGAAFASWWPWGGISDDPHASSSETDIPL